MCRPYRAVVHALAGLMVLGESVLAADLISRLIFKHLESSRTKFGSPNACRSQPPASLTATAANRWVSFWNGTCRCHIDQEFQVAPVSPGDPSLQAFYHTPAAVACTPPEVGRHQDPQLDILKEAMHGTTKNDLGKSLSMSSSLVSNQVRY